MSHPGPGWYDDPHLPGMLRWWDGSQWTAQVVQRQARPFPAQAHPPGQVASEVSGPGALRPGSGPPSRGGIPTWAKIAASLVVVVVAVPVLVIAGFLVNEYREEHPSPWPVVASNAQYDFTEDVHVGADDRGLYVPVSLDESTDPSQVFTMFLDPGLTQGFEVNGSVDPDRTWIYARTSPTPSCPWSQDWTCHESLQEFASEDTEWAASAYWLVRYKDADGDLDKPLVTKIIVDRHEVLAPPTATITVDNGTVTASWEPIEGATAYRVVLETIERGIGAPFLKTAVLAEVDGTSWNASADDSAQNPELRGSLSDSHAENRSFAMCVVATNGTDYSACDTQDLSQVAIQPTQVAEDEGAAMVAVGGAITPDTAPTKFYFTSLGDTLCSLPAQARASADGAVVFTGLGTTLTYQVTDVPTEGWTEEGIAAFNARSAADISQGGASTLIATEDESLVGGSRAAPDTPYPVYGTSDLVTYLAKQMIAHTGLINVEDFYAVPGQPLLSDAVDEAIYQNPYIMSIDSVAFGAYTVQVTYRYTKAEQEQLQQQVFDKVNEVVAATTSSSMSTAQKVTALNDWLAANARYDYDALAASKALEAQGLYGLPDGMEYAWDANGVLLQGTGVCSSYAKAYDLLANAAGVSTVLVVGTVTADMERHAWNKSYVDGVWKNVDVTWNDTTGYSPTHEFLMINDSQFTGPAARVEDIDWIADNLISQYATP